jgi:twinkle protein
MTNHTHKPCPFCDSSDAFSWDDETGLFGCFSCSAKPGEKSGLCFDGQNLTPFRDHFNNIEELIEVEPYIPKSYRGISKATMEADGDVFFTDLPEGTLETHVYANGNKYRRTWLPKSDRHHFSSDGKMDRLQGVDTQPPSGKFITITEGEWDRKAVKEMMGSWPVYNTPSGTPSKDFWTNTRNDLSGFEGKILLSVDNDDVGDKLAEKFYRLFPGKVYRVNHGKYKDANEFLLANDTKAYKDAWWNAQKIKPDTILSTPEDFEKLYRETPDYEYFPTGIDELDAKMLGIHKGAFTLILAPSGLGKTEFMRYLEWKCLSDTEYSIACCHLEETPLRSVLGLVSYDLKMNVTRKDLIDDQDYEHFVLESMRSISSTERYHQFQIKTDMGAEDLIEQIRFLSTAMGVDYIFLEPIQDIISGDTSTKESLLTDLSNKLKRLAPELNVGIVVIAHANDDGEVKYCRSIVQSAAYEIKLYRDLEADDHEERNRMHVSVGRKNRTGGGSGPAGTLTFDKDTYMLTPEVGPKEPKVSGGNNVVGF